VTAVHDASFDEEELRALEQIQAESGLKVRVYGSVPLVKDPGPDVLDRYERLRKRPTGPRLRFGAVRGDVEGLAVDLDRTVALFDRLGYQIWLEAAGNAAVDAALSALERAAQANGTRVRRHRVEHVEAVSQQALARFKALGVVSSTRAPGFPATDEAGVVQAFGSDWPVLPADILGTIRDERALAHFTRDAAWAGLEDATRGTLAPGKLADFVVLSQDILARPPGAVLRARVLRTVLGGQDTWRASEP
jgi:predicted amidohydrolase YtcJ